MTSEQAFTNNIDNALERLLAPVAEVERPPYVRKVVSPFKSCLDGASREELTYAI